jgi:hypothetical protein
MQVMKTYFNAIFIRFKHRDDVLCCIISYLGCGTSKVTIYDIIDACAYKK